MAIQIDKILGALELIQEDVVEKVKQNSSVHQSLKDTQSFPGERANMDNKKEKQIARVK